MQRLSVILVFLLLVGLCCASSYTVNFTEKEEPLTILSNSSFGLVLEWSVLDLNISETVVEDQIFTELSFTRFGKSAGIGEPELPYTARFITVPVGADVNVHYISSDTAEISLSDIGFTHPVFPAQPSLSKKEDPAAAMFHYNRSLYQITDYQPEYLPISVNEIGYMRGQRLFEVIYTPVKYNPVENTLLVHENVIVELSFVGSNIAETESLRERTWSADFEKLFSRFIINYTPPSNRNILERNPAKYLIICHTEFMGAMQPFVEWKTEQGFQVMLVSTAETGTTNTEIKSYIQNIWDTSTAEDPAPSFLLFVGDTAQIPIWSYTDNQADTGVYITDLTYVRLQGTGSIPDMYYGRFSAQTLDQLTPQIEKSIMYQKLTMPEPEYLGTAFLVAGYDNSWSPQYANGQMRYANDHYVNEESIDNNYDNVTVFWHPINNAAQTVVRAAISQGSGFMNYSAHGNWNEWSGTGGSLFNVGHIHQMTNYGKYPVVITNACLTNKFSQPECFGEALLRAEDKGAIIHIGASDLTYWYEDFYFAVGNTSVPPAGQPVPYNGNQPGLYDLLYHTHGEDYEDWHTTAGAMIFAGNMAVQTSSASNARKNYYWGIYHVMGDPSTTPYSGIPFETYAVFPEQILMGQTTMPITYAAPYARVALSFYGELHATGFTDEFGDVTLEFAPFTLPGTATLVITAQNHEPIITDILILPSDTPYLILESIINNETGNNSIDFASTAELYISLNNIGQQPAEDVTLTLSTTSSLISLQNDSMTIEQIPANEIIELPDPFIIDIISQITDQTSISLTLSATATGDPDYNWEIPITIVINASAILFTDYEIIVTNGNNNGLLDPGDTADIIFNFMNLGHATSLPTDVIVATTNPLVTIETAINPLLPITQNQSGQTTFTMQIGEDIPAGALTDLGFYVSFQNQHIQQSIPLEIGLVIEDFETGDLSSFDWENIAQADWTVVSSEAYQGEYSARSGEIVSNQTSILQIEQNIESASTIRFAIKTSCHATNANLQFYINNVSMGTWSGETDWTWVEYPVQAGNRTFRWVYRKTNTAIAGQDAAWIDYIIFPSSGGGNVITPIATVTLDEIDFGTYEDAPAIPPSQKFSLLNLGNITLSGNIILPENITIDRPQSFNINTAQNIEIIVTATHNTAGLHTGNIIINSNDQNNPSINIPITIQIGDVSENEIIDLPQITALKGNYPNPFNPETTISLSLAAESNLRIDIYNIKGQKVKSLLNEHRPAGNHNIIWNGKDDKEINVSSGIYFYRMQADDYEAVKRMVLLK